MGTVKTQDLDQILTLSLSRRVRRRKTMGEIQERRYVYRASMHVQSMCPAMETEPLSAIPYPYLRYGGRKRETHLPLGNYLTFPLNRREAFTPEGHTPRWQGVCIDLFWQPSSCHVRILLTILLNNARRVVVGRGINFGGGGCWCGARNGGVRGRLYDFGRERHEELGLRNSYLT